jgi:hypothetical protein
MPTLAQARRYGQRRLGVRQPFSAGANYAFIDDFASPTFAATLRNLHNLAALGRDGLGTIVCNLRKLVSYGDDTNLHNFQNSRYIITVAASDYFGQAAVYSSPGASILVSAEAASGSASGCVSTDRIMRASCHRLWFPGENDHSRADHLEVVAQYSITPVSATAMLEILAYQPRSHRFGRVRVGLTG